MSKTPPSGSSLLERVGTIRNTTSAWCYLWRWQLVGLACFLAIAIWQTWPVFLSPFSKIPIGSEDVATVPLYSMWATWWNSDRLAAGLQGYWNAPIFFPTPGTYALSESQPTTMVVAPIIWLTGSRVLGYNLYVWLCLALNGVFAQRLLKVVGIGPWFSLWGGMAMVLLPAVVWQLGIIQLVPIWGILWTWTSVEQLCREPTRKRGIELGCAAGVSFVMCMHHGLFLAILLIGSAPTLWKQMRYVRNWASWLIAVLVALVITVPFVYNIHHVVKQHRIEREQALITELSAVPSDYLQAYGGQLIDLSPKEKSWRLLSPGLVKIVLAIIGVVYGLRGRDSRRWSSFLLVTAVLAFLLSLGPNLKVFGWQPWLTLVEYISVFRDVRTILRFAFFVQMVVVIFASLGMYSLYQTFEERLKGRGAQIAMRVVLVLIAATALFEVHVLQSRNATVPDVADHQVWIDYVRTHTPPGHGIACIPFAKGEQVAQYQGTTEWMYLGTFHRVPLVNGYSTHFPKTFHILRHELTNKFPTEGKLRQLRKMKVRFLVLRRPTAEGYVASNYNHSIGRYFIKHVCADKHVDVFEVGRHKR